MITEILADLNNPENIILFTEDSEIFYSFKELPECIKAIPYMRDNLMVGADLWFPRHYKGNLEKKLKGLGVRY